MQSKTCVPTRGSNCFQNGSSYIGCTRRHKRIEKKEPSGLFCSVLFLPRQAEAKQPTIDNNSWYRWSDTRNYYQSYFGVVPICIKVKCSVRFRIQQRPDPYSVLADLYPDNYAQKSRNIVRGDHIQPARGLYLADYIARHPAKKGTRIITIRVLFFLPRQARRYRFFQAPATRGRQAHSGAGRARRAARGCQACRS